MKIHKMQVSARPFNNIKTGKKVIESRLLDEKRQQINIGDTIVFSENNRLENFVEVEVINLLKYKSFKELFENNKAHLFGESDNDFLLKQIREFYSDDEERMLGVVGIYFTRKN